jgi:hypothetical protein
MIVMPGLRRFIGGVGNLFRSASFSAPLTHSLVLERGTGTPTFTRATTGAVSDNEGILRTAIAGEARFVGARRVRNLVINNAASKSEDMTSSGYTLVASATKTATTITYTASGSDAVYLAMSGTVISGSRYVGQVTLSAASAKNVILFIFQATTGTIGTVNIALTSTPTVYSIAGTASGAGALSLWVMNGVDAVAGTITATKWQFEDITGRTDQSTPSEYVSVGVLSAPYHGAGVDGVEYFNTDLTGAAIPAATNLGYLAEPAATNLCLQSESFGTTWVPSTATVTTNQTASPTGEVTADLLTNTGGGGSRLTQAGIIATSTTHTYSIYVKASVGTSFTLLLYNATGAAVVASVDVNLTTGATTNVVGTVAVSAIVNSWWRVSVTNSSGITAGNSLTAYAYAGSSAGAVGSAVYLWGAQVELGSSATSYIPTTTVAVARNADVLTYPSAGNVSDTAGTLYCEAAQNGTAGARSFVQVFASAGNVNQIYSSAGLFGFTGNAGTQANINAGITVTSGSIIKTAYRWGANNFAISANGAAAVTDTSGSVPSGLTTIYVGTDNTPSPLSGTIRNVRTWNRALSSSELQAITR